MKKFYLLGIFCLTINLLFAQNITVKGTVIDDANKESLAGVSIQEKGTSTGTTTELDGTFSIQVSDENAILIFSYIGYAEQEEALNGRRNLTIALNESSELLNEVVVTALGLERKSKDLGYAVQSLNSKEISTFQ